MTSLVKNFIIFRNLILYDFNLTVCYYHVTYEFQSESTLSSHSLTFAR